MTRHRYAILVAPIVTAGISCVAAAQDASGPKLEEVVVTAQRRVEALQNVPISLTVASGEQLERAGVTRLEDISQIAPAVQLSRTGIYTQPAIRGITTTLAGNYENNVAIYVDGYYLPFTRGLNTDLVNISQLQVLKGPQGTLFGRNATGGAILIQTLDPSLTEMSGRVNATYRRFDDRQVQGYFSIPLIDNTLAWNVAANYRKSDDYIKDIAGFDTAPIKNYDVSTKVMWRPIEDLTISGKYEDLSVSDGRTLATTYEGRSLVQRLVPGTYLETRDNRTSVNFPVDNTTYQRTGAGKVEYNFGWGRLNSITAYQQEFNRLQYDLDGTKVHFFEQRTREKNRAFSEDFNLTSLGDGALQYVIGAYYFKSQQYTPDTSSLSALAALPANRTIYVPGGIRYSHENKDVRVECPIISSSCPLAVWFDGDHTFKSWTPRGVVRYQLDDASNVYASFSRGFKSGLINIAAPFNTVNPEKIDAYEVGYKTARGRWRLDTAAYYYDYKDLQVSSLQIINGINTAITTNATSARIYGAEAQLAAEVIKNLNVTAGLAFTHARYKDFPNAVNALGATQDWSGKQLVRAPDWTGNLAADYTLRTVIGKLVFAGNYSYSSNYAPVRGDLDASGNFVYGQGSYNVVNLRTSWSPPGHDEFTLSALGENVGNTRYYFYRSGNAFGDYHVLGQPATWGVSADYRF
jgi:iron complex outermembrane receptor protein